MCEDETANKCCSCASSANCARLWTWPLPLSFPPSLPPSPVRLASLFVGSTLFSIPPSHSCKGPPNKQFEFSEHSGVRLHPARMDVTPPAYRASAQHTFWKMLAPHHTPSQCHGGPLSPQVCGWTTIHLLDIGWGFTDILGWEVLTIVVGLLATNHQLMMVGTRKSCFLE